MFWSRIRKDRMLGVAREVLGVEWAHAHRKDKKAVLATAMETAFAKADSPPLGVTKEGHAAALAWAPPGFAAFDSGHVDDTEAGEPEAAPSDEPQSGAQQQAAAEQPEPAAETGNAEQAAPSEPSNGAPDGDAIAPVGHEAIDAMNAVPIADGGPRVIVNTVGFENDVMTAMRPPKTPSHPAARPRQRPRYCRRERWRRTRDPRLPAPLVGAASLSCAPPVGGPRVRSAGRLSVHRFHGRPPP